MKIYTKSHRLRLEITKILRSLLRNRCFHYSLQNDKDEFILHTGNNLSELIYIGKAYEPIETVFCKRYLTEGDVVFDVGANIGYFTTIFSRKVGQHGKVIAFEPGIKTFALLIRTIEILELNNAVACPFAIWNKSEILSFNNSALGDDAQQSFGERTKFSTGSFSSPVAAVSGNDLLNSEYFNMINTPSLIKIDVEGVEPQVLDGFSDILKVDNENLPVLLVECNKEALLACNNSPNKIISRLIPYYDLYYNELHWPVWYTSAKNFSRLHYTNDLNIYSEINILAIPKIGNFRNRALKALEI